MTLAAVLYLLVPLLPVLVAPLLLLPGGRRWLPIAPWVPLSAFALLPFRGQVVELPWLLLETRLGIDDLTLPLVMLAAIAWTLAGWHARQKLGNDEQPRFFFFWQLSWCGSISVFLTLDTASFYAAYTMLTIASYGLVVHRRRPEAYRAGRVYLWMAIVGEGLLLGGLLILIAETGNPPLGAGPLLMVTTSNAQVIAWLMLLGFGIKTGLAGLHMWLPLAHPQAPVPASAVLSGVIVKAGLIGWLRFLPLGQEGFEPLGHTLLVLGLIAAILGALVGVTQRGIKSLLAYSSISQMGLVSVIVALALLDPSSSGTWAALAVLLAVHHGLNKAALFLSVDLLETAPRLMRVLLWLPTAALAGLPLTSGGLVKLALKNAIEDGPARLSGLSAWVHMTSVVTTLLMVRFMVLALAGPPREERHSAWPWLVLLLASVGLPWVHASLQWPELARLSFGMSQLIDGVLPIAAGLLLSVFMQLYLRSRHIPEVPPGDLLHLRFRITRFSLSLPLRWPALDWEGPLGGMERRLSRLATALVCGAFLIGILVFG